MWSIFGIIYFHGLHDCFILFERTVDGVDYVTSFMESSFGPCDPCTEGTLQTNFLFQIFLKDDNDLEFDHGFTVSVSSFVGGIVLPSQITYTIVDDGKSALYASNIRVA